MMRPLTLFTAAALVTGCGSGPRPQLTAASPASPHASEAARFARTTSLRPDEATRKTSALLSAAQKEQEHWDAYGPVSGTPADTPKTDAKPGMKHDHH